MKDSGGQESTLVFSLSFVAESRDWLSETLSVDKWLNVSRKNDMLVK